MASSRKTGSHAGHYYPVCLDLRGRSCVVVGGGRVAERKVLGLLTAGARVTLISPAITEGLAGLSNSGRIDLQQRPFASGDLHQAFLVIAATDDIAVQDLVCQEAESANILLNVADVPERCNFILPATVRRGDLGISISTGGNSPALAKKMRQDFEKSIGPEYAALVALLGALRPMVLAAGRTPAENKILFATLIHDDLPAWVRAGDWQQVEDHLRQVLGAALTDDWKKVCAVGKSE